MSWFLLFLACSGSTPEVTKPVTPPVATTPTTPAAAKVTIWTTENIQQLKPVAPTRQGKVPTPLKALPAYDEILTILSNVVEKYAGDPDNPWAVAHGLLAMGSDFTLVDGRPAVPQLFATYAEPRPIGKLNFWGFPRSRGEIRVEPHTDLLLKNMEESGVLPDAVFPHGDTQISVADLYRYTLLKTSLDAEKNHSSFDSPNDIPWGLQALAAWAPDSELQWVASDGTRMDLDVLTSFLVAVLTQESAFMFEAMQKGLKFERSGQPLFSYTCGGAHLLQGSAYAVARGFGTPKARTAVEAQVPLMFYRMPIEIKIYEDTQQKAPKFKLKLLVQEMKFLGHWLENMSKLSAMGFYTPNDAQQVQLDTAAQNLVLTVQAIRDLGAFDHMEEVRKGDEQLYLDIVGDASHAIRGMELALGRGTIAY